VSIFAPEPEWQNLDWHRSCVAAGALCILHCASCGAWRHPPRRYCASCWSDDAAFEPVAGRGVVASLAVSHRALDPAWADKVPFATLVIELEEGPRVLARYDGSPDSVAIGDPMTVTVESLRDDFVLLDAHPTG
jgi:uncharacterized OB-fold protein